MTISEILGWIHAFAGYFAMYVTKYKLANSEIITRKELGSLHPQHRWISSNFAFLYFGWLIFDFVVFMGMGSSWNLTIYAAGSFFASIGLFLGVFAWRTGVCVVPSRSLRLRFVVGDDAFRAGRFQTIWSLIVIGIAIADSVLRAFL